MTFEEYARARHRILLRTATAITGDPHLAQDIVQDVLIKLARRWADIGQRPERDAYVRRMLVNEYISWRRKWARLVPARQVEPDEHTPDHAGRAADRDELERELAKLPRHQQVVLALRYFEGLGDADIAAALGCAESTVRSYAARALAALRIQFKPELTRTTGGPR